MLAADAPDRRKRVDGVRGGRTHRRGDEEGLEPADPTSARMRSSRADADIAKFSSTSISRTFALSDTRDLRRFLDRGMRLGRGVGDEVAPAALLVRAARGRALARREKSAKDGARGGVLDDAATLGGRLEELAEGRACRRASRARGSRAPSPPGWWPRSSPESRGRPRGARRGSTGPEEFDGEVREEARRLPVSDPRKNDLLHVAHHRVEALARLRRSSGEASSNLTRLDTGENGEALDPLLVVGDPVDQLFSIAPEFVRRHVGLGSFAAAYLSLRRYLAMVWSWRLLVPS